MTTKTFTKTRFAPSPTGLLHLGNARTALFSALLARRDEGVFLLRIEDTDQERSKAEYTEAVEEDLRWLGLDWQEGPNAGGLHGPYLQSERGAVYRNYFDILEQEERAYLCFCSDRELDLARKTQLAAGQPPRYPGTCARLSPDEVVARLQRGLQPTLRFRVPPGQMVEFDDLVRGPQRFASADIGDFIIRRADGTPAFFFSNAIDDALMGVTHVLRGEDHLTNTPRQILLLDALGLRLPRYGHISMILGPDGAPLSKRHGSRSIRELRETGYLPGVVNNYMARLGHYYENNAYLNLAGLAAEFDIANLGRAPAHYDTTHLLHWQREAIVQAHADELWRWMGAEVHALVPTEAAADFVAAVRANVTFPEHALDWARIIYTDPLALSHPARQVVTEAGSAFFEHALTGLARHSTNFKELLGHLKNETGAKGKALFHPLRAALTGELDGPEMANLMALLSPERTRLRLQACLEIANCK
ncbi:MAG: glutamate--tRNA ligase [Gammaproteobacteria bacterium]|nr:glutamate--tRNA ligase [Gammaproteobacteria bacterium]